MSSEFAGADWIKSAMKIQPSPLGATVADFLGDLFLGIYHLNQTSLGKADWENESWVDVVIDRTMSTYDDDLLTRLVVLAYDRMLRVELSGCGPGYTRLTFYQRGKRSGRLFERIPELDKHIESIRESYQ